MVSISELQYLSLFKKLVCKVSAVLSNLKILKIMVGPTFIFNFLWLLIIQLNYSGYCRFIFQKKR